MGPEFPSDARTVLLTETAKFDPEIVSKIETHLRAGKSVVITTGLLNALEDRGIQGIVELEVLDQRGLVDAFRVGWGDPVKAEKRVLIPQLRYLTNDSWSLIDAVDGEMGWPLFHDADYGGGHLFVWTIPDNPADLYVLPEPVLSRIRQAVMQDLPVRVDAPARVSLFLYDNDTMVLESFLDESVRTRVVLAPGAKAIRDLESGESLTGQTVPEGQGWFRSPDAGRVVFEVEVPPHSYRAFTRE